jgi:hypothetical protein
LIRKVVYVYDHVHVNVHVYVDALVNVAVDVHVVVDGFWRIRLRSCPFEWPATIKPPALPEDTY